ncbi:MAG: hypothetical protein AAF587_33065 [Bacteroidota bacterium]
MFGRKNLYELARKANGIGIVCGLEILLDPNCILTITKGYGITSKGIIVEFPEKQYKYYKPYEKKVKGLIPDSADHIEVWELIPEFEQSSIPLTPQTLGEARFIDGKVVLLYVEKPEQGKVVPLVIDRQELWSLLRQSNKLDPECLPLEGAEPDNVDLFEEEEDDFPSGSALYCTTHRTLALSPISMMRFGFATDESDCKPEDREFKLKTADADGVFAEYKMIILDALKKLKKGLKDLHTDAFLDLIPEQQRFYLEKYFFYLQGKRLNTFFDETDDRKNYIQLFHDLVKDLLRTYNELVEALCHLMADCCPDVDLFPCHLLLGEIQEDIHFGPSVFRHHFRQPPIYNHNQDRFEKIRFLHWRMAIQIKNFYIPYVEETEMAESHYTQIEKNDEPPELIQPQADPHTADQIRITLSYSLDRPLGEQAIPFYYHVSNEAQSMHRYWSYEAVKCCRTHNLLSYHAEMEDSYTHHCSTERPLAYQDFPHSFYRIEGVIGQKIVASNLVLQRLIDLRIRFNLGFEVLLVNTTTFFNDYESDQDWQIAGLDPVGDGLQYLGAEHIGGIVQGGTYVLLIEDGPEPAIIGDFWIPHCCVSLSAAAIFYPPEAPPIESHLSKPLSAKEKLIAQKKGGLIQPVGTKAEKELKEIYSLGPQSQEYLKSRGIQNVRDLAAMTVDDLKAMMKQASVKSVQNVRIRKWIAQAILLRDGKLGEFQQLKDQLKQSK